MYIFFLVDQKWKNENPLSNFDLLSFKIQMVQNSLKEKFVRPSGAPSTPLELIFSIFFSSDFLLNYSTDLHIIRLGDQVSDLCFLESV